MESTTIEQQAYSLYQTNLNYFKNTFPELYEKLNLLDVAIQLGQYKENLALEYNNNYFDLRDEQSKEWLYGENSLDYSNHLVNLIDKKKTGGVFEAQRNVDYSPEMPDIIDKSELHFHNALWASIKIIDYVKNNAPKNNSTMKNVYKSIFIGTGLGFHIDTVINHLNSKVVFIYENNLELFRCSLFCFDYEQLSKKAFLFFSIMDAPRELEKHFIEFLEKGNNYNLYLKYIPFTKNYDSVLQHLQTINLMQTHIYYPYSAFLLRYSNNPQYIAKNGAFIKINQRYSNNILSSKPILLVFSGPSTAKNLEWLKNNADHFIVITALSTCRLLYKNNIKPDIIMHQDPGESTTLSLFEGIDPAFFENIIFIASSNVYNKVIDKFDFSKTYFIQQESNYKYDFGNFGSLTAGEYTYAITLLFGATEIYLLGIDLALDATTYQTHSHGHSFLEHIDQTDNTQIDKNILYVKGNFQENVPTLPIFQTAIQEFARFSQSLKTSSQNVFNLSDGAFLEGSIPKQSKDINQSNLPILHKKQLHCDLVNFLDSISSREFRIEDKQTIKHQLLLAKNLLKIIKKYEKSSFSASDPYLDSLAKLSYILSDRENKTGSYLSEVYYYYFKVILSYIYDLFNTEELTQIPKHIKSIHTLLIHQLNKIALHFISSLEIYLNKKQ